jgi:hypothetical protein
MDRPTGHYVKWNEPDSRKTNTTRSPYIRNEKTNKNNELEYMETKNGAVVDGEEMGRCGWRGQNGTMDNHRGGTHNMRTIMNKIVLGIVIVWVDFTAVWDDRYTDWLHHSNQFYNPHLFYNSME